MKKSSKQKTSKKAIWPWDKPVPRFASEAEELEFWQSYEFEPPPDTKGEQLFFEPTRQARKHVYQLRLDDKERMKLQMLAKRRGVTAAVALRELIHTARGG